MVRFMTEVLVLDSEVPHSLNASLTVALSQSWGKRGSCWRKALADRGVPLFYATGRRWTELASRTH